MTSKNNLIRACVLLAWAAWFSTAHAQVTNQIEAAQAIVAALPAADVPARCSDLVAGAPSAEQAAVAASLIQAVAKSHPAALKPTAIGIVARVLKVAPAVAGAAAESQPESSPEFLSALVAIPGVLKTEILTAVIGAAPQHAAKCLKVSSTRKSQGRFPGRRGMVADVQASIQRS